MVNQYLGLFWFGGCVVFFWVGDGGGEAFFFFHFFFGFLVGKMRNWQVDVGVIVMQGSGLEIMRFPKFCVVKHPDLYIYI